MSESAPAEPNWRTCPEAPDFACLRRECEEGCIRQRPQREMLYNDAAAAFAWDAVVKARQEGWLSGYRAAQEQAAKVAEKTRDDFLSPRYAANQPLGSFCERFACDEVATAIRTMTPEKTDE